MRSWIDNNKYDFENDLYLLSNLEATCVLLSSDSSVIENENLQKDFRKFVIEFARRRNLDIQQTFSKILTDWILEDNHGKTL